MSEECRHKKTRRWSVGGELVIRCRDCDFERPEVRFSPPNAKPPDVVVHPYLSCGHVAIGSDVFGVQHCRDWLRCGGREVVGRVTTVVG